MDATVLAATSRPSGPETSRFWIGMLILWAGLAAMFGLEWGIGLIGVGVIHIACQVWRTLNKLPSLWAGHAIGVVFVLAGSFLYMAGEEVAVFPVLVISAGSVVMMAPNLSTAPGQDVSESSNQSS
jgi:hypothetical protein